MTMRRGIAVFLILTLGVSTLIVGTSVDRNAVHAICNMKKIKVLSILLTVFLAWCCDAFRFCLTAKAMGYSIPFFYGIKLTWLHYFGCAITPMQVGGGPFQVYALYKKGIPVGSGIAITLVRTLFSTFLLSIAAPLAFFMVPQLARGGILVKGVFLYVGVLSAIMWILFILSVTKASLIKHFCSGTLLLLKRLNLFKSVRIMKASRIIYAEVDSYSRNIKRMVGPGFVYFSGAFLVSICHLTALFSVLPQLIHAVGLGVNYLHALLSQAMFMFILYFIPTPGASGVAEGGGMAIFSLLLPDNLSGIMAVLWRFFTEYLAIIMGFVVAIKMIGWGTAEKIINGGQEDIIVAEENDNDEQI